MSERFYETRKPWLILSLVIGMSLFFLTCLFGYLFYGFEGRITFLDVFIIAVFAVFSGLSVWLVTKVEYFRIWSDKIEIKRLIGNKSELHQLSDFHSYSEQEGQHQFGKHFRLRLHGDRKTITIDSSLTQDYNNIKRFVSHVLSEDKLDKTRRHLKIRRRGLIAVTFFLLGTLSGTLYFFEHRNDVLKLDELTQLSGTLLYHPIYNDDSDNPTVTFRLKEYPEHTFRIGDFSLEACAYTEFLKLPLGDSIFAWIDTAEYNFRIKHNREPGFWDSQDLRVINVQLLSNQTHLFISLKNLNPILYENNLWGIGVFGAMSVMFIAIVIVGIRDVKRLKAKLNNSSPGLQRQ